MRLLPIIFYKHVETGKDRLGNSIMELTNIETNMGKLSNWSSEEIALEGREFTRTHEKLITMASMSLCSQSIVVELEGIKYEVEKVTNAGRWRIITVKTYKV